MARSTITRHLVTSRSLMLSLMCAATLTGCQPEAPTEPTQSNPEAAAGVLSNALDTAALEQVTASVWRLASLELKATEAHAQRLQTSIAQLLEAPNELTLSDARDQWQATHQSLQQLSPYFALGEINPGLFGQLNHSRFNLDAWPIQPGFLDYFDVYTHSGLVNDIAVPMTASTLRSQHGFSDNSDVSLGLHAMAYLLWGEQQNRPVADFVAATEVTSSQKQSGMSIVDLPQNRRRTLITLHSNLLLDDLASLQYRITHSASAMSGAYHALTPASRLSLWRQALLHTLDADLLSTQLAPKVTPSEEFIEHNQFSGHTHLSLQESLAGVERLLWHRLQVEDKSLVEWLINTPEQQTELQAQLQALQLQLEQSGQNWQQLPADAVNQLQSQLVRIIEMLSSAA